MTQVQKLTIFVASRVLPYTNNLMGHFTFQIIAWNIAKYALWIILHHVHRTKIYHATSKTFDQYPNLKIRKMLQQFNKWTQANTQTKKVGKQHIKNPNRAGEKLFKSTHLENCTVEVPNRERNTPSLYIRQHTCIVKNTLLSEQPIYQKQCDV